jgi:hypothetical protein
MIGVLDSGGGDRNSRRLMLELVPRRVSGGFAADSAADTPHQFHAKTPRPVALRSTIGSRSLDLDQPSPLHGVALGKRAFLHHADGTAGTPRLGNTAFRLGLSPLHRLLVRLCLPASEEASARRPLTAISRIRQLLGGQFRSGGGGDDPVDPRRDECESTG